MSKASAFWFIRDGDKLIQCSKDEFDRAILAGKSVKYRLYANKRCEKIAEVLEKSRMDFLGRVDLPSSFRLVLTDPVKVVEVQVIDAFDPDFWVKESKKPKYQI